MNKIIFALLLIFISCKVDTNFANLGKRKILFVEAHNKDCGIGQGKYGDIILYDINNKTKYKITDDNYFDIDPKFSPNGNEILFKSLRNDDSNNSSIRGIGGPYDIYISKFNQGIISELKINYQRNRPKFLRRTIDFINWNKDDNIDFFDPIKKIFFQYSILKDSIKKTLEIDTSMYADFDIISNVNYLENYIVFMFSNDENTQKRGIAVFNKENLLFKTLYISNLSNIFDLYKGRIIIQNESNLLACNLELNKFDMLYKHRENLSINDCRVLDDSTLIFLVSKENNSKGKDILTNDEVALYNTNSKIISWLTNDGIEKDCLEVYRTK